MGNLLPTRPNQLGPQRIGSVHPSNDELIGVQAVGTSPLEKVLILAGLRNLKPLIEQEVRQMPITVDIMENPFLREAFDKGWQEGRQEGEHVLLVKQLEQRFGPLPDEVLRRLETAAPELLEQWGLALLAARTLDEVFH